MRLQQVPDCSWILHNCVTGFCVTGVLQILLLLCFLDLCRLYLCAGRASIVDSLSRMSMDIFNSGVDEYSTPDIMLDITLGGTKTWQSGLNAKEPVCLNAFACFCISMLLTLCVHMYTCVLQPKPVPSSADVMQLDLCFYLLF